MEVIALVISILALGVGGYVFATTNLSQRKKKDSVRDQLSSRQPRDLIAEAASANVTLSRNWLIGSGPVALLRGRQMDVIGGLNDFGLFGDIMVPPRDFFDLSPQDEEAANQLTATLAVPTTVTPFNPFTASFQVNGPLAALERVNRYQLNVFGTGPILSVPFDTTLGSEGWTSAGSQDTSMWKSGPISLWAHFESGIREMELQEVVVDTSACKDEAKSLNLMALILQGPVADRFVERVAEEVGDDADVTVASNPLVTVSSAGFRFQMSFQLVGSGATILVHLDTQFQLIPKGGNLGAKFSNPGYVHVEIDADLPWYDDFWHDITLSEHNFNSLRHRFHLGLKALANGFANFIGRDMRGLPEEIEDQAQEDQAPKIIAASMDIDADQFVVTLCEVGGGLVAISGFFLKQAVSPSGG